MLKCLRTSRAVASCTTCMSISPVLEFLLLLCRMLNLHLELATRYIFTLYSDAEVSSLCMSYSGTHISISLQFCFFFTCSFLILIGLFRYWKLSLMVHPDKCPHPQANQAFIILNKAFKDLQDPDKVGV